MTKIFNPKLESHYEALPLHFWGNGKRLDGTPRKRKVMVKAEQGMVNAKHYYYAMYHPEWDGSGIIMQLNGNDIDFNEDNLILMDERLKNNIVHFNNGLYFPKHEDLQSIGILIAKSKIKLKDLTK